MLGKKESPFKVELKRKIKEKLKEEILDVGLKGEL